MILLIVIVFVSVIVICPVLYWYYLLYCKNRSLNTIPGPAPMIFLGNILSKDAYDLHDDILKLHEQFGPTFKIYTGPYANVIFSKPEHMQAILSSTVHLDKSFGYDFLKPWLGEGLIVAKGSKWRGRRKLLNRTFYLEILEEFMHTFNTAGEVLIEQLSKEVGKDSIDMFEFISLFGLDVICETAMGVKINAQTDHKHKYPNAVKTVLEIILFRMFCAWAAIDFFFWLFANDTHKKIVECVKIIHAFSNGVIKQRRKELQEITKATKEEIDEFHARPKTALLDFLLSCEETNSLSDEDIREEIENFMFAGHDTITTSLSLTFLELSRNPEVQNKLHEEIKTVIENNNAKITTHTLNEMKYLDMVVKEGLRIWAPVPVILRRISTDCSIDDMKLPKGTTVGLNINYMHHNPEIYPDPEKFDPERFTLENQVKRHPFAYVPFSAGPRNCIGHRFATLEMKATMVKILRNFEILPVPGFKERLGFTGVFKSKNGACVRLKKRL